MKIPGRVKGREWDFHVLVVLPDVGTKAIVNHFRLRWVQGDGEEESGATNEIL
jgi:hypothetical protein